MNCKLTVLVLWYYDRDFEMVRRTHFQSSEVQKLNVKLDTNTKTTGNFSIQYSNTLN